MLKHTINTQIDCLVNRMQDLMARIALGAFQLLKAKEKNEIKISESVFLTENASGCI